MFHLYTDFTKCYTNEGHGSHYRPQVFQSHVVPQRQAEGHGIIFEITKGP